MIGEMRKFNLCRKHRGEAPNGRSVSALLLALVAFNFPLGSRAQTGVSAQSPSTSTRELASGEYQLNPGDVLEVLVYDVPELSHSYTVSSSGSVTVPLLSDPVRAAGLTTAQFARALEEAFRQSGRLRRPEIAVSIAKPTVTSSVAVEGAVKSPLMIPEIGQARLVDIITQCGGFTDDAGGSLTITRGTLALRDLGANGEQASSTLTLDLKKVMDVSDPASRTVVWPGDRVSVERALPEVYYVMGEVTRPGGYSLKSGREELTVLRALALAGDETSVAKKSKAMIIRKDPKGPQGREEIKLDLKKILLGKTPDPKLQADDILFVPSSTPKKALHSIEGAPTIIAGEAGGAIILAH
jgi:polysaccharide export outer membrane protein